MDIFLTVVGLSVVCFIIGKALTCIFTGNETATTQTAIGFVIIIAVFQIISLPFMYHSGDFNTLYFLFLSVLFIAVIISLFLIRKNMVLNRKLLTANLKDVFTHPKKHFLSFAIILLIMFQMAIMVFLQSSALDDSFYIAVTSTTLSTGKIMGLDPISGFSSISYIEKYMLVGYEIFMAVLSRLFHINPAVLYHTAIPIFIIGLHYFLVYGIGRKLFDKRNHALVFVLIICILNLFSSYSRLSEGAFLLLRPWMGKAVLVNILLPFLLYVFISIFNHSKVKIKDILLLTAILWAGNFCTTVGLFLMPIFYFGFAASFLVYTRSIKDSWKLVLPILFILPFVYIKASLLTPNFGTASAGSVANQNNMIFFLEAGRFFGEHIHTILIYVVSLAYILIMSDRIKRFLISIPVIVIGLTFLNPLFADIVVRYVTTSAVYWRLFWCLQYNVVVGTALVLLLEKFTNIKKKITVLALFLVILLFGHTWMLTSDNYQYADNKYKLHDATIEISDTIINDKDDEALLLAPNPICLEVRQYTGDIMLISSRYNELVYNRANEPEKLKILNEALIAPLYEEASWDIQPLEKALDELDVVYIVLYSQSVLNNPIPVSWDELWNDGTYTLYRIAR